MAGLAIAFFINVFTLGALDRDFPHAFDAPIPGQCATFEKAQSETCQAWFRDHRRRRVAPARAGYPL